MISKARLVTRRDYGGGDCLAPSDLQGESTWTYDIGNHALGKLVSEEETQQGFKRDYLFDSFGRSVQTNTELPGDDLAPTSTHSAKITYDGIGRVFQTFDAAREGQDFSHSAVQNIYDERGFLWKAVDAERVDGEFRTTYYQVDTMDQRGNVTSATLGDGVIQTEQHFYEKNGLN